jgi:hypothetical protein
MSDSHESSAAILARVFQDPEAKMGEEWLDSVGEGWTGTSLHRLVVTNGTLSAAKSKEIYGHFSTKTQMRGIPGPYTPGDKKAVVAAAAVKLNQMESTKEQRLAALRTEAIGGILLVTTVMTDTGATDPFITIIAAPSLATYNETTGDRGLLYDDIWDPVVLDFFNPDLERDVPHCPLIGAQMGSVRASTLKPELEALLQDSQPLFFPEGELVSEKVTTPEAEDVHLRAVYLPEIANLPLGMRWPIDIGSHDFLASIQGALGAAGVVFHQAVMGLDAWFDAVALNPMHFAVPSCAFSTIYDLGFMPMDGAMMPPTVLDHEGFSPLVEMLNGHLWRLWCDKSFTTDTKSNREYLATYLAIGSTAITPATYFGAAIPGRFCPNFAYHFQVANSWPTDTSGTDFLKEFRRSSIISVMATQHAPMNVDLHQPDLRLTALKTIEQCTVDKHKQQTPGYNAPPKRGTYASTRKGVALDRSKGPPLSATGGSKEPPLSPLSLPSTIQVFKPSPLGIGLQASNHGYSTSRKNIQRQLDDELLQTATSPSLELKLPASKGSFDPLTTSIRTEDGRAVATDTYLNACRLLAHHSSRRALYIDETPVDPNTIIYVREPCGLFRREILRHLAAAAKSTSFMPTFHSFMEAMLSQAQIQMSGIYDPQFFTGFFLDALLTVETWMVSDQILPSHVPPATFHVYRLISCLQKYAGHELLLPVNGLSMLEATQVGLFTYHVFAMMDLSETTFSDSSFAGSILGQRLKAWSTLPSNTMIHHLWNQAPLQATYHWFASLQMLLRIEQNWVKRLRYHPEKGFYLARDATKGKFLLLDSQIRTHIPGRNDTLIEAMRQFDHIFEARWFRTSVMDPVWTTPIPLGYAKTQSISIKQVFPDQKDTARQESAKRLKLDRAKTKVYDFNSTCPPMEIIEMIPGKTVTATLMRRFTTHIRFPRLNLPNGTSQTICLNSAFQSPHNCCESKACGDRTTNPRTPRFHLDLSREPWRSKPEDFWSPLVLFLQTDAVRPHIRPSQALQRLTPSTQWT